MRHWSKVDDEVLRDGVAGGTTIDILSGKLGRSELAIRRRLWVLGIGQAYLSKHSKYNNYFQDWEDELIVKQTSLDEIMRRTGRSAVSLWRRAGILVEKGLLSGNYLVEKTRWSEADEGWLKENHMNTSFRDMAEHLKRSERAVMHRVYELGLRKRDNDAGNYF